MNNRIYQAAQLYKEASELIDTAAALLELEGIRAITDLKGYYNGRQEIEVHLYRGIEKTADDEHKIADRPGCFKDFSANEKVSWIKINGVNFIQLKKVEDEG